MVDELQLLYLEQEVQEMMEAFERQSHERVWNVLFRSLPESKQGLETYPDLVRRVAALTVLIERGLDRSEDSYLQTKLTEDIQDYFAVEPGVDAGSAPGVKSIAASNFTPSVDLQEQLFSFHASHEKPHPDTIMCFDSPLQSTIAASWLLAALERDPGGTAFLPVVRLPEVLSLHTNSLLIRQPCVQKWKPESVFIHAVWLAKKRMELGALKKVDNAFKNANRLHGWIFREMIASLGLVFEGGLITVTDGGGIEEALEQGIVLEIRERLCELVPPEISEKIKETQLKARHFAVAQRVGMWGDFDAGWLFLLRFLERRLPDRRTAQMLASMEMPCRDWWAFPGLVVATRRPIVCGLDEHQIPHREDGKAIEFADGFGVYVTNGERVSVDEFQGQRSSSGS